jgi:cytochrome c oxidase subunit 4
VANAQAKHTTGGHEEGHGMGRYIAVWAALIAGTILTVITGRMNFGELNIIIALVIACIKASLVVLFFMHLWDEGGVNRLIFVTSLVFVMVMILGTFGDLAFRLNTLLPNGGPLPAHSEETVESANPGYGAKPPATHE